MSARASLWQNAYCERVIGMLRANVSIMWLPSTSASQSACSMISFATTTIRERIFGWSRTRRRAVSDR